MSDPRDAQQVYAEQVAQAQQAVDQAQQANDQQQSQAQTWLDAGLPADANAVTPGSHQHD